MKPKNDRTVSKRLSRSSKKQTIWIVAAICSIVIALAATFFLLAAPRDIGKDLTFIKKVNTGCEWWEFPIYLGFCRLPNYEYYFATDMNKEDLSKYFRGAEQKHYPSRGSGVSSTYTYDRMYFSNDKKEFSLYYYNETQAVKNIKAIQTDKKHIISMSEESYNLAKDAY